MHQSLFQEDRKPICKAFSESAEIVLSQGDALDILKNCPSEFARLIITSPPYNLGKRYESQTNLENYLAQLKPILEQLIRVLATDGSLCWQVGNFVDKGEVFPLDIYFYPIFKKLGWKSWGLRPSCLKKCTSICQTAFP